MSYLYAGLLHLMQHSLMLTSLPQRLRVLCGGPSAVRQLVVVACLQTCSKMQPLFC